MVVKTVCYMRIKIKNITTKLGINFFSERKIPKFIRACLHIIKEKMFMASKVSVSSAMYFKLIPVIPIIIITTLSITV